MRKYFIFKSSDQDKSLVEAFNKLLLDTKRKKIITFSVLIVCFIMSAYSLSSDSDTGGGSILSSPKDKAVSKIKHYQELNNKIIKDLRDEDVDAAIRDYRKSDKYYQEVVSQDEYLNDNFKMDVVSDNSYYYVTTSGTALFNEINENGKDSPRLSAFINECIGYAEKANENMGYTLDEIDEIDEEDS